MSISITGTPIEKNLLIAFAGESQARKKWLKLFAAAEKISPACRHPQACFGLPGENG